MSRLVAVSRARRSAGTILSSMSPRPARTDRWPFACLFGPMKKLSEPSTGAFERSDCFRRRYESLLYSHQYCHLLKSSPILIPRGSTPADRAAEPPGTVGGVAPPEFEPADPPPAPPGSEAPPDAGPADEASGAAGPPAAALPGSPGPR